MKQKFSSSLLLLLLLICCMVHACKKENTREPAKDGRKDISQIDSKMKEWMEQHKMPGASLAVSKNGKMVYAKGYGVRDKDNNKEVTTETQFRIASVSKLITSVAIMKLIEEGKLKMSQKIFGIGNPLGTTYGSQPYKNYVTEITVSDLLHHTAGGWGQDNDPPFFDTELDATKLISWTLDNITLNQKPNTTFAYSNFGYILLEKVVEKLSGSAYADYVNKEIWQKVGASRSVIAGNKPENRLPDETIYYGQANDLPYVYTMNLPRAAGAMGWVSTPKDLLRFATAVDSTNTRADILQPETIQMMVATTPASKGFGFHFGSGWVVEQGEWFWWGTLPGTYAILYRNANGICVAAAANSRFTNATASLNSFIGVINYLSADNAIPWQDIDQF